MLSRLKPDKRIYAYTIYASGILEKCIFVSPVGIYLLKVKDRNTS